MLSVMFKIVDLDPNVNINTQLEEGNTNPVILLSKFIVRPDDIEIFLKVFENTTKIMKQQPGFISAQLHQGIAGSHTFFNYGVWESAAHFKRAFNNPAFQKAMSELPQDTVMSPHLFRKVAISNICVD